MFNSSERVCHSDKYNARLQSTPPPAMETVRRFPFLFLKISPFLPDVHTHLGNNTFLSGGWLMSAGVFAARPSFFSSASLSAGGDAVTVCWAAVCCSAPSACVSMLVCRIRIALEKKKKFYVDFSNGRLMTKFEIHSALGGISHGGQSSAANEQLPPHDRGC